MATYILLLYPTGDFSSGLPIEQNAMAAGTSPHTVTLDAGAAPVRLKITDDDSNFDEVDSSAPQVLAEAVTVDGVTYPAGTTINTAYDLQNSGSGHRLTSVHFGGDGYQQGAVHGAMSTVELVPGDSYVFDGNRTSNGTSNSYTAEYIPCLARGTRIGTPEGPRRIETLVPGDRVLTRDAGAQPVVHIWHHSLTGAGKAAPLVIPAGVLGAERSLWLSREHRVMLPPDLAETLSGRAEEALVAAKFLRGSWGIESRPCDRIEWWHLLLDGHHVLDADGVAVESYLWTVKPSHPAGAPLAPEVALPDARLQESWPEVRPVLRWRHLRGRVPV